MAGSVNRAKAWDGNGAVPRKKVVDRRRLWHRHEDRAEPLYGREGESFGATDDWRVGLMGDHPSTRPAAQLGHASSMVRVLVREQDSRHLTHRSVDVAEGALDPWRRAPAGQAGIDEDDAVVDHHQVDIHKTDPQLEDTVDDLTHEIHDSATAYGPGATSKLPALLTMQSKPCAPCVIPTTAMISRDASHAPHQTLADTDRPRRRSLRNETHSWARLGPNAVLGQSRRGRGSGPCAGPRAQDAPSWVGPPIWGQGVASSNLASRHQIQHHRTLSIDTSSSHRRQR